MSVARADIRYIRRYKPAELRRAPRGRLIVSTRAAVVCFVLAGAALQHIMAVASPEQAPAPLVVTAPPALPVRAAATVSAPHPAAAAPTYALLHSAGAASAHASPHSAVKALPPTPMLPAASNKPPSRPSVVKRASIVPVSGGARALSALLPPIGAAGDLRRMAMAANPEGNIMHVPSVSVQAIRAALSAAGSPAAAARYADHKDAAEYIWDAGRVLGVDPAVLMAIFKNESLFGTRGMARLTNSVGNIRPLAGQPSLDGYRLYASWEQGIDSCYLLLRRYALGGATTLAQAIPTWAPASDNNDPQAYTSAALSIMGDLHAASVAP